MSILVKIIDIILRILFFGFTVFGCVFVSEIIKEATRNKRIIKIGKK